MKIKILTTLEKYRDNARPLAPPFNLEYHLWWAPTNEEFRYVAGPFVSKEIAKQYAKDLQTVYSSEEFIV